MYAHDDGDNICELPVDKSNIDNESPDETLKYFGEMFWQLGTNLHYHSRYHLRKNGAKQQSTQKKYK